jgi:hypothetical protein
VTDPQFLFVAEYPCDRFCRIELDLSEVGNLRFTFAQMRRRADDEHKRLHAPTPEPIPIHDKLSATFRAAP